MTDIARERRFFSAQGLDIHYREEWSSQSYASAREVFEPVEGFVLHISVTIDHGELPGTEYGDMRTIERIGNERFGGIGFPYNAAIFDTGRLYEGQPLTRRGAHTVDDKNIGYRSTGTSRSMNFWWRAICLPQMITDDVTDAQVVQCARWAAAQIRAGYAKRWAVWIGHRDVAWKDCPGATGYARLPEIRSLTEHYVINGLHPLPVPSPQEDAAMYLVQFTGDDRWFACGHWGRFHLSQGFPSIWVQAHLMGGGQAHFNGTPADPRPLEWHPSLKNVYPPVRTPDDAG